MSILARIKSLVISWFHGDICIKIMVEVEGVLDVDTQWWPVVGIVLNTMGGWDAK